jgi:hypothetical protein
MTEPTEGHEPTPPPLPWKRLLLSIGGTVLGLFGAIYGIGLALPHDFAAHAVVDLPAPPPAVWAALQDYRRLPISGAACQGTTALPASPRQPAWQEAMGESTATITTVAADPVRRWEIALADSVMPLQARWVFTLTPTATGTQVTIDETGSLANGHPGAPVFRAMMYAFGGIQAGLDAYVSALTVAVATGSAAGAAAEP